MVYDYTVSLFYEICLSKYKYIEIYCPDAIINRLLIDISSCSKFCIEKYLLPSKYRELEPIDLGKRIISFGQRFDDLSIEVFQKCIFEFISSLPNSEGDQKKPSVELLQLGSILGNTTSERLIDTLLTNYKEPHHD